MFVLRFTVSVVEMEVFYILTTCNISMFQRFGETCFLNIQGDQIGTGRCLIVKRKFVPLLWQIYPAWCKKPTSSNFNANNILLANGIIYLAAEL